MSYIYEILAVRYSRLSEEALVQKSLDLFEQIHPGMRENFEGSATWSWLNHPYSKGAYMLGHSDLETTLITYTHAIPDSQRTAVERVARVLFSDVLNSASEQIPDGRVN